MRPPLAARLQPRAADDPAVAGCQPWPTDTERRPLCHDQFAAWSLGAYNLGMAATDLGYKRLFSHREMVADLLTGFIHEPWVAEVDLQTLERVSGSYVSDDLRERADDVVWRVRWRGGWLYVYLLLEFQSAVDRFMALRVLVYVGLLYQDLIRAKQLPPSGRLPPVMPIVLYNGEAVWTAARDVRELIESEPGSLEQYHPQLRYCCWKSGGYRDED